MRIFFSLVLSFFLLSGVSQSNETIRFIDINYIVNNSSAGKSLNKIIENKNKTIDNEIKDIAKKLEDKKKKIVSQKNILKKEEFDKLVINYDKELKSFNNLRKKKKKDFDKFRIESSKKILDLLNPIIKNFLKNESIKILLQKEKIIFADDELDITKEILEIFNIPCNLNSYIKKTSDSEFKKNIFQNIFLDKKRIGSNPRYVKLTNIGKSNISEMRNYNRIYKTIDSVIFGKKINA